MASRKALITGGSKGIGLAAAKKFLAQGFSVVALGRDFSEADLPEDSNFKTVQFDLQNIAEIPSLAQEIGRIDVLINNAGIMHALPYDNYPEQKKDEMLKVNLEAPIALIQEFSKPMIAHGGGRIVNNASIAGEIGHPDIWYGITKAGLINLTKSFAKILGPKGIVVNAVASGPVETAMLATIPEARQNQIKQMVYTARFAKPEEIAETMYWLGTDSPEYINGICIDINNGAFPR